VVQSNVTPASPKRVLYQPVLGAHIYVERDFFSHHGIDCGDGTAIDFAGRGAGKNTAIIRRVTLAEFANGALIRTRSYGTCYPAELVVARAIAMIGRSGYDLFSNNCEHFATWCVTGEHSSAQVEAAWSAVGVIGMGKLAPGIGRSAVVGLGETAPRSAANVMSGLTRLGGSAIGGVTVVAGAGAVVGAGTMMLALRDKPYLTDQERTARRAGRIAGVGGAAVGTWAAVQSVGALGIAGYGAAGLSSGLAALGSVAGGGMVTGVAVVGAIPLLAAFGFALLAYRLMRWLEPPGAHPHPRT
jgi:lecithin:retinol acyltransferase